MNSPALVGLMLLNATGAFCLGFAVSRLFVRPKAPDSGVRLTSEDLLGDLRLDLARDENDLEATLIGLDAGDSGGGSPEQRIDHLRKASRFSEQRLTREHQRLVRLAEASPAAAGLADEVGRHRDRAGELSTMLEKGPSGEAITELRVAITEFAVHNRKLSGELEEARAKLAARETELIEAQRDARLDSLTRIANRRCFEERIAECQTRLERGHEGYAVALFDVDRFKAINDKFGHAAGDAALAVFAKILKDTVRSYDLPFRYGGEEFMILLPGADLDSAEAVTERCRKRAENAIVRHGHEQIGFTVTAGIATGRESRTWAETVARADEALYAAKVAGRNRVLTEEAELAPLNGVAEA